MSATRIGFAASLAALSIAVVFLPALPASASCHLITFVGSPYQVGEGAGKVTITLSNNGGAGDGSVDYQTVNGSAKAGQDYKASSGTVSWTTGIEERSFDVPILNDKKHEQNETFSVQISNPQQCASQVPDPATVRIVDDDKLIVVNPTPTKSPSASPSPSPTKSSPSPAPARTKSPSSSPSPSVTPTPTASAIAAPKSSDGISGGAVWTIVGIVVALGGAAAFWVRKRFLT